MTAKFFWNDRVVLVTGGSSGLGRIIAEAFSAAGARVAIVALEEDDVTRAAQEISNKTQHEVLPLHANITRGEDVSRIVESVIARFGSLNVLVNNAGRSMRGTLMETTPEQFRALFELNVLGMLRCTQTAMPHLLAARGSVVNIGSLAAKSASRFVGAYPASKHAVAAISQQLRLELGDQGLHVLLVCPGPIRRDDARLYQLEGMEHIPVAAREAGGGVKVEKISPEWLAQQILRGCEKRRAELIVPRKARILFSLAQLSPTLGDWLVKRFTP